MKLGSFLITDPYSTIVSQRELNAKEESTILSEGNSIAVDKCILDKGILS